MNADFIIAFRESVAAFCGNAGFLFSAIESGFLNPYERGLLLTDLRKYSAKLYDSIEAVDVLIRPAAGTNPGEWTSDLLLLTEAIRYDLHTLLASNTCDPIEMWSDAEAHLRPILERTRQNLCKLQTKVRFLDNLDLLAVIQNTRQFIAQTKHNELPAALPTKPTADDPETHQDSGGQVWDIPQTVTLDQMASAVSRSKKTLERLKKDGTLPLPDVEGGGGKRDEWHWVKVKPILEERFGRKLPEKFPTLRRCP
jgi:hypothetical protein